MEFPIGNMAGDFERVDTSCPRCGSTQVVVGVDSNGYFYTSECMRCGYRHPERLIAMD